MKLVYLDESGTDKNAKRLCVAGVLIDGDIQTRAIQSRIEELIEKTIPADDRTEFSFHATEIYHGSGYFDRGRWSTGQRFDILMGLARIIADFKLPVVVGSYDKDSFGSVAPEVDFGRSKIEFAQTAAMVDCALAAERWLATFSPSENAIIIAEDRDRVKKIAKVIFRLLRDPETVREFGLHELGSDLRFPLTRVIDTVHFAIKPESVHLQLADLCAFVLGRLMNERPVLKDLENVVVSHYWRNFEAVSITGER